MNILIISIYDGGLGDFNATVMNDEVYQAVSFEQRDQLLDIFRADQDNSSIRSSHAALIGKAVSLNFDRLIVCEDGQIDIYNLKQK